MTSKVRNKKWRHNVLKLRKLTKSSGSTNSVEIGLGHAGEVEVDDDIDGLNVDTASEEIGAHQVTAEALKVTSKSVKMTS